MIAWGGLLLLETRLVLLVDNHQAKIAERKENGAAGTEDDVVRAVGELFPPYLHPFVVAVFTVVDAELTAEDVLQALRYLHRQSYLG